ncbi:MAG: DUF3775 domain-containing protein [Rhodanobacter sp.]|nr:DUF3775 domain-containing protein [Rhodanobacter sp.]
MAEPTATTQSDDPQPALAISTDTVCFILDKLREYDALDMFAEPAEETDNPLESEDVDETLEKPEHEFENAPVLQELAAFIGDLPDDEQIDLVAIAWLGRDNNTAADWPVVREEAAQAHSARTVDYLLGTTLVANFLEDGLALLGRSCEDSASERL